MMVLLALCAQACMPQASAPTQLYVATKGNDSNPGTQAKPLATLAKARDALRALRRRGKLAAGATVWVRGGAYELTETLELTREDSGTAEAPIVYRAAEGEAVRLVGGRAVGGFEPVSDKAILGRLDPKAHGHALQCDLGAQGITDFGKLRPRGTGLPVRPAALELFFRGKPMPLARWPNKGYAKIARVPKGKPIIDTSGVRRGVDTDGFHTHSARLERWATAPDAWVYGYWMYDWADSYHRVKAIDPQKRLITIARPLPRFGFRAKQRWRALNLLEELDQPGEWYLDRATGILTFWPPKPVGDGDAWVSRLEGPMVACKSVSHVELRGFTLECSRGSGVTIAGGTAVTLAGCTLRNLGNLAITIQDGTRHRVVGCDACQLGDGAITATGGDRKTLTPGGHTIENCHIHHMGRWCRCYRPAVVVRGVGHRVAHNLIHHGPHAGILLNGNDHTIELNRLHHLCLETGDVGAFYMGRDWTMRGNVVRHNLFHDLAGPGRGGAMAVYLDDCASGTMVVGNVFVRAGRAILIGGGRDNTVRNNVFVDCRPAVHIDQRAKAWANKRILRRQGSWNLFGRLEAMPFDRPPYSTRYPKLARIRDDDPLAARGNTVERNLCVGGRCLDLLHKVDPRLNPVRDNLVGKDPGFVDPAKMDFRLKPGSPALALGFEPIPLDQIGLRRDAYRRRLPPNR